MSETTLLIAFFAGLLSFLSPCVLPLVPGFLSYLSGVALGDKSKSVRAKMLANTAFYVLGFTLVFSVLGVLLSSILANAAYDIRIWLGRIGGAAIILFGLFVAGILKLDFLEREYRLHPKKTRYSYLTSFIFGASFAAGWSPCIGPVLGSVLALASIEPANSFFLLLSYSAGLALPFFLVGAFASEVSEVFSRHAKLIPHINKFVGLLLVLLGILVFTGELLLLANLFPISNFIPPLQ
jgi:cytochrome c-type biogenesis protein